MGDVTPISSHRKRRISRPYVTREEGNAIRERVGSVEGFVNIIDGKGMA